MLLPSLTYLPFSYPKPCAQNKRNLKIYLLLYMGVQYVYQPKEWLLFEGTSVGDEENW